MKLEVGCLPSAATAVPLAPKAATRSLRCAVLGAGGFIGRAVCARLGAQGVEVRGFGRSVARPEHLHPGVEWVSGDLADRVALTTLLHDLDVVLHLASSSVPEASNRDPAADLAANIAMLDICRGAGVRKVVFASSGGTVYGVPAAVPIPETAATDPISAYGVGKLAIEKYLALYKHLHGLDYSILRVANPYGPGQSPDRGQGAVAALMHRVLSGRPVELWGDGSVVRDFVHIDDVAEAFAACVGKAGSGRIYNVGSGVGRSIREVLRDILNASGCHEIEIGYKAARAADVPSNILDIDLIGAELGWTPKVEWSTGLRETVAWLKWYAVQQGSASEWGIDPRKRDLNEI